MLPEYPLAFTLPNLAFVRDLEAFDGPILSVWRAADGRPSLYLDKWCTREGAISRSIVVRTEYRAIAEYLGKRISMRQLLIAPSDGIGFVVDRKDGTPFRAYLVTLNSVEARYLPSANAFHDETLRPSWSLVPQSFLVGEEWEVRSLATIERRYHDVAGFCFLTEPDKNRELPHGILTYVYDRGYPIGTAFQRIRAAVPHEFRAKSVGVAAGSPGVLTLDAPSSVANRLAEVLTGLPKAAPAYNAVLAWSKTSPKQLDRMPDLRVAMSQLSVLCEHLKVAVPVLVSGQQQDDAASVLNAGKLLAAYHRKLWQVVSSPDGEFVSVSVQKVAGSQPEIIDDDEDDED